MRRLTTMLATVVRARWATAVASFLVGFIANTLLTGWWSEWDALSKRPRVRVEAVEGSDSGLLVVDIHSPEGDYSTVDQLFLEIEIPGTFTEADKYPREVGGCDVVPTWMEKEGDKVTRHRIVITCHDIVAGGYFTAYIRYQPIRQMVYEAAHPEIKVPPMPPLGHIRNYPPVTFTWVHSGNSRREHFCADLTNLSFVQEANRQRLMFARFVTATRKLMDRGEKGIAFAESGTPTDYANLDAAELDRQERARCNGPIDFRQTPTVKREVD